MSECRCNTICAVAEQHDHHCGDDLVSQENRAVTKSVLRLNTVQGKFSASLQEKASLNLALPKTLAKLVLLNAIVWKHSLRLELLVFVCHIGCVGRGTDFVLLHISRRSPGFVPPAAQHGAHRQATLVVDGDFGCRPHHPSFSVWHISILHSPTNW